MNLNQMINETKQKIVTVLNESRLPIEMIDMLLENILLTVRTQVLASSSQSAEENKESGNGTE